MIKSLLLDSREPAHIQGIKFPNIPVMKMTLETGDIWVSCDDGNTLIIERKSPNDLMESIADNRLFNQAAKMRQASEWCYVIVTGNITPAHDGTVIINGETVREWQYSSIEGALMTVQEMGVIVTHCNGEQDFAPCIERLAKRNRDDIKVKPVRNVYVFGGQEAVLASLPGIGTKKAVDYMKLFDGNLGEAIMNLCTPNPGFKIPGWGEKSAQNLKEFFNW